MLFPKLTPHTLCRHLSECAGGWFWRVRNANYFMTSSPVWPFTNVRPFGSRAGVNKMPNIMAVHSKERGVLSIAWSGMQIWFTDCLLSLTWQCRRGCRLLQCRVSTCCWHLLLCNLTYMYHNSVLTVIDATNIAQCKHKGQCLPQLMMAALENDLASLMRLGDNSWLRH